MRVPLVPVRTWDLRLRSGFPQGPQPGRVLPTQTMALSVACLTPPMAESERKKRGKEVERGGGRTHSGSRGRMRLPIVPPRRMSKAWLPLEAAATASDFAEVHGDPEPPGAQPAATAWGTCDMTLTPDTRGS